MQNNKVVKKKKIKTKKKTLRFIFFGITSFVFLVYFFNMVVDISKEISEKYSEKNQLNTELTELKEEEEKLSLDVKKLQDPEYVARYLREKYHYSKTDEFIIKLPN